jgi:aminoglycoside phosphotransferase (APT) family kinase protein
MTESTEHTLFDRMIRKMSPHSKLLRAWDVKGGVSAQVTALEIEQEDGQIKRLIVRQHGEIDLKQNPRIAADEYNLLDTLHRVGLAVPKPYFLDSSGEILSTPYLVMEYIEGVPDFAPADVMDAVRQMADYLSRIHTVDLSTLDVSFLVQQETRYTNLLRNIPAVLHDSLSEGRIREALTAVWPLPQRNRSRLLHGDYWPGNILWKGSQLMAIIDWEDAAVGDPLADMANSRLEILWAFGLDAMQQFTQHYQTLADIDFTHLSYWDLIAALRPASKLSEWGLDEITEKRMRDEHKVFITQAFEKLV